MLWAPDTRTVTRRPTGRELGAAALSGFPVRLGRVFSKARGPRRASSLACLGARGLRRFLAASARVTIRCRRPKAAGLVLALVVGDSLLCLVLSLASGRLSLAVTPWPSAASARPERCTPKTAHACRCLRLHLHAALDQRRCLREDRRGRWHRLGWHGRSCAVSQACSQICFPGARWLRVAGGV